jgi:metal-responsive CopG/Arc/MetJ family transcriptional regulator
MENPPLKRYLSVLLEETLIAAIDDFKFSNRLANRTEAIRVLITQGLSKHPPKSARINRP